MDIFRFYGIFPSDKLLKIAGGPTGTRGGVGGLEGGGVFQDRHLHAGELYGAGYPTRVTSIFSMGATLIGMSSSTTWELSRPKSSMALNPIDFKKR